MRHKIEEKNAFQQPHHQQRPTNPQLISQKSENNLSTSGGGAIDLDFDTTPIASVSESSHLSGEEGTNDFEKMTLFNGIDKNNLENQDCSNYLRSIKRRDSTSGEEDKANENEVEFGNDEDLDDEDLYDSCANVFNCDEDCANVFKNINKSKQASNDDGGASLASRQNKISPKPKHTVNKPNKNSTNSLNSLSFKNSSLTVIPQNVVATRPKKTTLKKILIGASTIPSVLEESKKNSTENQATLISTTKYLKPNHNINNINNNSNKLLKSAACLKSHLVSQKKKQQHVSSVVSNKGSESNCTKTNSISKVGNVQLISISLN